MSEEAARAVLLAAQGLLQRPQRPAIKADVLATIRRMAVLQIDTISVVARSPYLVLWSRLGAYDPHWLDELLAEGSLFEYWSHAACFLPIEHYGLYRREMLQGRPRARAWLADHPDIAERVRERLRDGGEVRSADFERTDGRVGAWWDWKPEKLALECLFSTGEIMIARRTNFQRIYDVRERVLPGWDDTRLPPPDDVQRTLALEAVRALGVTRARWVPDYFRTVKKGISSLLEGLVDEGKLVQTEVDGWSEPAYIHPDNLAVARRAAAGRAKPSLTTLLSPFDPLVWDRARALALFNFEYRIETYTPTAKRRYGYFSLPILHRGALVGRLDAKAHRKERRFEVRALHLEPGVLVTSDLITGLAEALQDCAAWHATPEVSVVAADPANLARDVTEALTGSRRA